MRPNFIYHINNLALSENLSETRRRKYYTIVNTKTHAHRHYNKREQALLIYNKLIKGISCGIEDDYEVLLGKGEKTMARKAKEAENEQETVEEIKVDEESCVKTAIGICLEDEIRKVHSLLGEKSVGVLSQAIFDYRRKKEEVSAILKDIEEVISSAEFAIITLMEETGLEKLTSADGTITKKVSLYPSVQDMESFIGFIYEKGRFDFIQKRVNEAAFREYYESTGDYPNGLDAFPKTRLNYRKK